MATNSSDMGDSQTTSSSASGATIDWTAAFQSPEILSGLQGAIAGVTMSNPRPEQLEQLGDSISSKISRKFVKSRLLVKSHMVVKSQIVVKLK